MFKTDQRAYPRTALEAPIQYAILDSRQATQFHCARMLNYSTEGICYEIHQPLDTHTEVCVVMHESAPGQSDGGECPSYLTLIQWARPASPPLRHRFSAGARIIDRNYKLVNAEKEELMRTCDLCGAWQSICHLTGQHQDLQLCNPCDKYCQSIPEGPPLRSLERFLVGNLV